MLRLQSAPLRGHLLFFGLAWFPSHLPCRKHPCGVQPCSSLIFHRLIRLDRQLSSSAREATRWRKAATARRRLETSWWEASYKSKISTVPSWFVDSTHVVLHQVGSLAGVLLYPGSPSVAPLENPALRHPQPAPAAQVLRYLFLRVLKYPALPA